MKKILLLLSLMIVFTSLVFGQVLTEDFEGGALPADWSTELVDGTVEWTYETGGNSGHPATAHGGDYNALFYGGSYTAFTTRLITPTLDLSGVADPALSFWLANDDWAGDQDILNVYYRDAVGADWVLLTTYDTDMVEWGEQVVTLPNTSSDYYISFEGVCGYGYGVCIDDIVVGGATETMTYQVRLYDSYGDGWDAAYNGPNLLDVTVDGVVVLDDITLADGTGPEAYDFEVNDGSMVVVDFASIGDYPGENSYDIVNEEGTVIYTSSAPPEASYSFVVGAVVIPNVFFSEYIEGSSNNKAIEIYNGTEEDLDLANYRINQASNGGDWEYVHTFPEGAMIASGDVWVIAADGLSSDYYPQALCDEFLPYPSVVHYNGNDARALEFLANGEWMAIDIIGVPTEEIYWSVAGVDEGTKDHTIVRKDAITTGNTDWAASAGTSVEDSEWMVLDQNTFGYLGWHMIEPAYIGGTVTLDMYGDVTDATIEIDEMVTHPTSDGYYVIPLEAGTYDVTISMPGYYEMSIADVACTVGEVAIADFALTVTPETLWPPVNLSADIMGSDVAVAWTAPSQYGWNGYYQGPSSLTWAAPERATFFDVTDFGFSYPMDISSLSHGFYHHSAYPWGEDTTFSFKIYDTDGSTLLFESAPITALEQWDDTIVDLETAVTVTGNFWVSVAVTNTETGFPSSLFSAATTNLHGYVGSPGDWGVAEYDWATEIYIMGEEMQTLSYGKLAQKEVDTSLASRVSKRLDSVRIDENIPTDDTRDLLSFNLFRDGTQINTEPIYDAMYTDMAVPAGEHTYYTTALWNYGESEASNTATVNLSFGALSGNVADDGVGVEGAVISAGTYSATTDTDGDYLIEDMLIGTYEVSCSATGYDVPAYQTAEITDGGNTVIDFVLESSDGTIAFNDDFETGADNWVFDAESTWGLTEEDAHSPSHSMTESPNSNYTASQNISATLATPWDLSGVYGAQLSFWYKSDIETAFDYMYLEVSTDGTDWAQLAVYDEEDGDWQEEIIPMGGFVGAGYETVSIRFRFESDGGYETVGMLIDDVTLTTYDTDIFEPFISHTGPEFYEGTPDAYEFMATIVDISGIAEANVVYTVDGGEEMIAAYTAVDGNEYTFVIPSMGAGCEVWYGIEAVDAAATPNTALKDGFAYIAGTQFIYDNGIVDFYTVFAEGTGAAELILNPAGNQLNLAYALIRNYTDQSGQDNDPFEFHVWSSVDGLPGEDLITPFVVVPEASYANTSPMTRIDLRDYATELNDIQGNFFIGFLVNQGGEFGNVHCTTTSDPAIFSNSYSMIDGIWSLITSPSATDLHFRAVAELIPVTTGIVAGTVTDTNDDAIAGATVTIGTAMGTTDENGAYSVTADPGMQDVMVEADSYVIFNGSVDVIPSDTVTYDVELEAILWAPSNLTFNYNDPNLILSWEEPTEPQGGEDVELVYDDGVSTGAYAYTGYSMGAQMSPEGPCQVISLKFHTSSGTEFNAEVWGWEAGAPNEDMLHQELANAEIDDWVIVDVAAENMMLDGDFVVAFGSFDASTYLSYDANLDNGRAWDHADTGGWYSWTEAYMVRAVVQYVDGTTAEIAPTTIKETQHVASRNTAPGRRISVDAANNDLDSNLTRSLAGYNVYRNDVQLNTDPVTSLLYVDPAPFDYATYYVTAVYESPDGESVASNSVDAGDLNADEDLVLVTELKGNYPNPFNPTTAINFSIVNPGKVSLKVYNAKGQLVKTLINEQLDSANYEVIWNGTDSHNRKVTSGIYFYRMMSKDYSSTKKMMLLK